MKAGDAMSLTETKLTPEQIALFDERGYHIHGKLFDDAEIEAVRAACDRVGEGEYETEVPPDDLGGNVRNGKAVQKIDNVWKANQTVARMVTSPKIGHVAAQLIQAPSIRLWHDQYLRKPPHGGQVVTYHQDWAYWQMIGECQTVTCWIALSDVHAESGPMIYMEGSHKFGLFPLPKGISGDDVQMPPLPESYVPKPVPLIIQAGCVGFHHGLLLHDSEKNFSDADRFAIVSHVLSGECTYRPGQGHVNETMMQRQPDCPQPGEAFRGPQFPPMWPAEK